MALQDGNGGGNSGRRQTQLVFVPTFTNPGKDSKRSETRKLVAKYAMIGRNKNSTNSVPSSATGSSASSAANTSTRKRNSSSSKSPDPPPQAPPTPESLPTPRLAQRDPGHDTALFTSNATHDYYSLPTGDGDLCFRTHEQTNYPQSRSDEAKQRKQSKAIARKRAQNPMAFFLNDDDDKSSTNDDASAVTTLARRSGSINAAPLNPMSYLPAAKDPFDCMPAKHDAHTQELLYLYLNAHFLSPAFTQGSPEIPQRIKSYRQSTWFPLIMESKATFNALIAWIESTPDLPVKSRDPDFLLNHVQAAYEGMRYALSNPRTETDDAICVAVVLLMLTAQRLGETATFRAHASGLLHLLGARSKAFRHNKLLRDREQERWQHLDVTLNGPPNPDPCGYCRDEYLRAPRSPSPESPVTSPLPELQHGSSDAPSPANEPIIAPSPSQGIGFKDLIQRGYLSPVMSGFVEQILIWIALAGKARRDRLSSAAAATHAWIDERPGKLPPLDTACQFAVRLCLYLSVWLEGGHSCSVVRRMATAVYLSLRSPSLNISHLLQECPHFLLWLTFVVGPFAHTDMSRQWFMCLLTRARYAVSPTGAWDFDEIMEITSDRFVWTTTMRPGARRFWNENAWDLGTAITVMENPF